MNRKSNECPCCLSFLSYSLLTITLSKIPYVNDELIWKDKTNKNLGYNIKKGLKSLYLTYKEEGQKKTELKEVG